MEINVGYQEDCAGFKPQLMIGLDKTLTKTGYAADAKATGDAIASAKEEIVKDNFPINLYFEYSDDDYYYAGEYTAEEVIQFADAGRQFVFTVLDEDGYTYKNIPTYYCGEGQLSIQSPKLADDHFYLSQIETTIELAKY